LLAHAHTLRKKLSEEEQDRTILKQLQSAKPAGAATLGMKAWHPHPSHTELGPDGVRKVAEVLGLVEE